VALAGVRGEWALFAWFLLGAFAMRSAGCVYNDIVDRDLDRQVERTRLRPLASRRVSLRNACMLAIGLSLIGLTVLIQLPRVAQGVALISIFPVAAYPFMKRITWWPQAWLGLVFSWGALVGWPAVTGEFALPALLLWLGSIFWVIGYDTLYAIQDIEDDELVGVKSSARALGDRAQLGVAICYALALVGWAAAIWWVRPDWVALLALLPAAIHLARQVARADPGDGARALQLFRSNRFTGLLLFLGFLVVGLSSLD
jgi:4-hydroxybenzoate polyprenyltransferase